MLLGLIAAVGCGMEYFAQKNFKDNDYVYEEKNKSNGCGGAK